jgi:multiple sugar transport system permease protein
MFRVGVMILFGLMFLYPIVALLLAPTRSESSMMHGGLAVGSWANVAYAWKQIMGFDSGMFLTWLKNTVVMVVGGAILAILLSIPTGYAMARLRFVGRNWLIFVTLLLMVMPNTVLTIPLFLEVSTVHLLNSFWPVIVIYGFYPFGVYLSFIHFKTALPMELIEAGRMDGLSELGIFFRIAVPLARQAVALVGFFGFVAGWTNFFLPYVLLPQTQTSPLAVGLLQMISSSQLVNPEEGLNVQLYMPELALAAVITMLPVMVIFIAAQRYLQRGATMGAVKG